MHVGCVALPAAPDPLLGFPTFSRDDLACAGAVEFVIMRKPGQPGHGISADEGSGAATAGAGASPAIPPAKDVDSRKVDSLRAAWQLGFEAALLVEVKAAMSEDAMSYEWYPQLAAAVEMLKLQALHAPHMGETGQVWVLVTDLAYWHFFRVRRQGQAFYVGRLDKVYCHLVRRTREGLQPGPQSAQVC